MRHGDRPILIIGVSSICALLAGAFPARGQTADGKAATRAYHSSLLAGLRAQPSPDQAIDALVHQARRGPSAGLDDLAFCPPTPPTGIPGVTNDHYYFLSEILPGGIAEDSPACGHALACFLRQMVAHQVDPEANPPSFHSDATLIVDRQCVVNQTLVVPNRFVLAGVGTEGRGVLAFYLPDEAPAIRFATSAGAPQRFVTIRDLNIVNVECCGQVGIDVSHSSFVYLDRVRVHDFGFGVLGTTSYSIFIDRSAIHDNGFNVVMGADATAWRIRDTVMSQSGLIGVVLDSTARGNLLSGARVESNPFTGIYVRGPQNVIENGWFEGNGTGFGDHGIRVLRTADQTRIVGNLFSSEDILDQGTDTQLCFNTDDDAAEDYNNCRLWR